MNLTATITLDEEDLKELIVKHFNVDFYDISFWVSEDEYSRKQRIYANINNLLLGDNFLK